MALGFQRTGMFDQLVDQNSPSARMMRGIGADISQIGHAPPDNTDPAYLERMANQASRNGDPRTAQAFMQQRGMLQKESQAGVQEQAKAQYREMLKQRVMQDPNLSQQDKMTVLAGIEAGQYDNAEAVRGAMGASPSGMGASKAKSDASEQSLLKVIAEQFGPETAALYAATTDPAERREILKVAQRPEKEAPKKDKGFSTTIMVDGKPTRGVMSADGTTFTPAGEAPPVANPNERTSSKKREELTKRISSSTNVERRDKATEVIDFIESSKQSAGAGRSAVAMREVSTLFKNNVRASAEITRFAKSESLGRRIGDSVSQWLSGNLTDATLEDYQEIAGFVKGFEEAKIANAVIKEVNLFGEGASEEDIKSIAEYYGIVLIDSQDDVDALNSGDLFLEQTDEGLQSYRKP